MDIGALSMIMSQSRVQKTAGIAVMRMAMDTGKENANQMTEIMRNIAVDSSAALGYNGIKLTTNSLNELKKLNNLIERS